MNSSTVLANGKRAAQAAVLVLLGAALMWLSPYVRAYHEAATAAVAVAQFLSAPVAPGPDGKPRTRAQAIAEHYPSLPQQ